MRRQLGLALCLASLWAAPLRAADSNSWFAEGLRLDVAGADAANAQRAFTWYRRAAEAGMPEAEFNVAVMFDSGRGVQADLAQAATWYARAASRGVRRAAYNLGLLYETGQGVPQNVQIARAWFKASGLGASRAHLTAGMVAEPDGKLSAPTPVVPGAGASVPAEAGGVELVWTSQPQPEPVQFFVVVRALAPGGSFEVFSSFTDTSSIFATFPDLHGDFVWRVHAVAAGAGRYASSPWERFSIASESNSVGPVPPLSVPHGTRAAAEQPGPEAQRAQ